MAWSTLAVHLFLDFLVRTKPGGVTLVDFGDGGRGMAFSLVRDVRIKIVDGKSADARELGEADKEFVVVDANGTSFQFVREVAPLLKEANAP